MDNVKKIISAALIMLTLSGVAPAQTDSMTYKGPKTSDYPRHELGVSYGLFPIIGVVPYGKYEKYKDLHPFIQGDIIWSGSANVYYRCWFNRHNSLSLDFSWAMYKHQSRLATDTMVMIFITVLLISVTIGILMCIIFQYNSDTTFITILLKRSRFILPFL